MTYWRIFWTIWLIAAGISFAAITAIVTVKGYKDLRNMFTGLASQQKEEQ